MNRLKFLDTKLQEMHVRTAAPVGQCGAELNDSGCSFMSEVKYLEGIFSLNNTRDILRDCRYIILKKHATEDIGAKNLVLQYSGSV